MKSRNKNQSKAGEFGKIKPVSTPEKSKEINEIVSFFKTLAMLLVLAIFLRASVVEAYKIPSGSMIPTLLEGDHILVSKLSYGFRLPFIKKTIYLYDMPQRGDVVVFSRPDDPSTPFEDESKINIIKRVIGLPGDKVEVRNRQVYINDKPLHEDYAIWGRGGAPEGNFGPGIVPEGHVFLLGDNRDFSKDSRFWHNGHYLPINLIKGRALFIYWSWATPITERIGKIIR
ncbi:MAG: signal peptidase I [Candidatus Dadabacteria bacterium]|nr:MAG: signal peptidase I [Candidatus Dadabacteria bacterium]